MQKFIPKNHCACGSYEHQIPMPIAGRVQYIDICVSDIVAALNAANITTVASCCGHGKMNGNILLVDGRMITISEIKYDKDGIVIPL